MEKFTLLFFKNRNYWLMLLCWVSALSLQAQDLCQPVGWATQNGGVTGGGSATPVTVTNYTELKNAITSSSVKVVYVQGSITIPAGVGKIELKYQSNKSIIGLPGSEVISVDETATYSGIFYFRGCTNIIMRNMVFHGPGAYDVDGNDNLTVDNCQNVWIDHCEFYDALDGNFDTKNASDFISVTWCIFAYQKPPIPGGSGGSNDHRFSNLIGSSVSETQDEGKLRMTFQYCWWGEGCRERMPRVRFGKIHLVNNLYSSSVSNYCIRAGYMADILGEGNYFDNQSKPVDLYKGTYTAVKMVNNYGLSDINKGTAFTPPYSITVASATSIVNPIKSCAGATLSDPTGCSACSTSSSGNQPPIVSITSPTANQAFSTAPANITITANASDPDGAVSKVEFYNGSTLLGTVTSAPYTYAWTNVAAGNYTITAKAYDNNGAVSSTSVSISVGSSGQPASLIKHGSGSSSQTISAGDSIQGFYYNWTNAATVTVTGLPTGISVVIDTAAQSVSFSGTPTQSGSFDYTITTVGGSPDASKTGNITINGTITLDCNGDINGTAYLDKCNVCVGGNTGLSACSLTIEGENACMVDGTKLETTNPNYEGSGYADPSNAVGAGISWMFSSPVQDSINITVRYANGDTISRNGNVLLNGNATGIGLSFDTTGNWGSWKNLSFKIQVPQGVSSLELIATQQNGLPNIDALYFSGGVTNPGCTVTGITGQAQVSSMQAYPNPFTAGLNIQTSGSFHYRIISLEGVLMSSGECQGSCITGNSLEKGMYFLEIQNGNKIKRMKIIKE